MSDLETTLSRYSLTWLNSKQFFFLFSKKRGIFLEYDETYNYGNVSTTSINGSNIPSKKPRFSKKGCYFISEDANKTHYIVEVDHLTDIGVTPES